jgi:hypothetical protein
LFMMMTRTGMHPSHLKSNWHSNNGESIRVD